jgi:acetyltransferase-like isoleucine patch superfamily enzyme
MDTEIAMSPEKDKYVGTNIIIQRRDLDLTHGRGQGGCGSFIIIKNSTIGKDTKIWNFVNIYDSDIGENCKIASFVEIGGAKIGDNCKIEAHVFIPPGVEIGNHVFIGPGVCFANDKYPNADPIWNRGKVVVKDDVSIGIGAIILPGVIIGERSFIAAGALVTNSVGPDTFVMGAPAHRVHKRIFERLE